MVSTASSTAFLNAGLLGDQFGNRRRGQKAKFDTMPRNWVVAD